MFHKRDIQNFENIILHENNQDIVYRAIQARAVNFRELQETTKFSKRTLTRILYELGFIGSISVEIKENIVTSRNVKYYSAN